MAAFCHFWRLKPPEYRALTLAEFRAMSDYMQEWADAQRR